MYNDERQRVGTRKREKPLLLVVEAKRNDFEEGWGQCLGIIGVRVTLIDYC